MTLKLELEHYKELEYLVSTRDTNADLLQAGATSLHTLLENRYISFQYSKFGNDLFYVRCDQIPNCYIRIENNSIKIACNVMKRHNVSLLSPPHEFYSNGEIYSTYSTTIKNPTRTVVCYGVNNDKTKCKFVNDTFKKWLDTNHISIYELTDEHKMMFEMEKELYFGG